MKKQIRTMMEPAKNPEVPDEFKNLPIKMDAQNNYPNTKFIYTLTDIDFQSISNSQAVELTKEIKEIPCRNLSSYRKLPPAMWRLVTEVLQEDKVSLSIEVKDINGQLIEEQRQILSVRQNIDKINIAL